MEPEIDLQLTVPSPDSPPAPEPVAEPPADTIGVEEVNHDRISRLETELAELRGAIAGLATVEALQSMTVPPHEHPELAGRITALEAEEEESPEEDFVIAPPEPMPEPEAEAELDNLDVAEKGRVRVRLW